MDRIITPSALDKLTSGELSTLFRDLTLDAQAHELGSSERQQALASLENVRRAIAQRHRFKR
ncbi:MAG: hypothetical protein R3E82_11730 [Pseudomonadales bacterium]